MLSAEQEFFLEIMKNSVNDTKTDIIPNNINWEKLISIAKSQEMKALLCSQVSKSLADSDTLIEVNNDLVSSYATAIFIYQRRMAILKKIETEFTKLNIPFFVFKGTEISEFYSKPEIRSMGDSDILVHEEDRERAHEFFIKLGMKNVSKSDNEWIYYYDNMEFELHCRLMNEGEVGNYQSHKDFMNRRWDYAICEDNSPHYHLDINYHFVFVLLHLRKHFINCGVGFRQFMDLAVMIRKCRLDWEWINNEIELLGLTEFSKTCFAFCERWFGVTFPTEYKQLDDDFYIFSTKKIFNNGIFGFDDVNNKENYTILKLKDNRKKGKFVLFFEMLFPSYSVLTVSPKYSFIKGKPLLLPIAWCYRIVRSVFEGTSAARTNEISSKMSISNEQISTRKEYLENWGLN